MITSDVGAFEKHDLLALIQAQPQGIKEYDLLRQVYATYPETERPNISDSLVLFQQHFWLFHILYKLRDQLHQQQLGSLIIEPLNIQWLPYSASDELQSAVSYNDPLREYYLNLDNVTSTDREEVDALLSNFWRRIADDTDVQQALSLFELDADTDLVSIKRRYRQLLAEAHPDRGGSHERAVLLNDAMAVLKRYYLS